MKEVVSGTLTHAQVIRALRRLERGWPRDLELFVGDGTVTLIPVNEATGEVPMTPDGGVDCMAVMARFPGIRADGGGW